MNKTPIQWTWAQNPDGSLIPMSGSTWNPLLGCKEVSPGCANCYAARLIGVRFSKNPKLPMYHDIATVGANGHPHFTGERRLLPDRLDEPLRARKGRKVFVCDMGDLFFEGHPFEDIAAVFGVMAAAPQHTFQVLTKRPERAAEFFAWVDSGKAIDGKPDHYNSQRAAMCIGAAIDKIGHLKSFYRSDMMSATTSPKWPLPNVWIGTSVENQRAADERIPHLLRIPAVVRFLSMEPLLEEVDLDPPTCPSCGGHEVRPGLCGATPFCCEHGDEMCFGAWLDPCASPTQPGINWVIVGFESGPKARPGDLAWARSVLRQCREAEVAAFVKQLGARPTGWWRPDGDPRGNVFPGNPDPGGEVGNFVLRDPHGGAMDEWPDDLRVREFPKVAREEG